MNNIKKRLTLYLFSVLVLASIPWIFFSNRASTKISYIETTNLTPTSFSLVWIGQKPRDYKVIIYDNEGRKIGEYQDDRDKEEDATKWMQKTKRYTHHFTITRLSPESYYSWEIKDRYFPTLVKTGVVKTLKVSESLGAPDPSYGVIYDTMGFNVGDDAYVTIKLIDSKDESSQMVSTYSNEFGAFSIDLSSILTEDLSKIFAYDENEAVESISVYSKLGSFKKNISPKYDQPVGQMGRENDLLQYKISSSENIRGLINDGLTLNAYGTGSTFVDPQCNLRACAPLSTDNEVLFDFGVGGADQTSLTEAKKHWCYCCIFCGQSTYQGTNDKLVDLCKAQKVADGSTLGGPTSKEGTGDGGYCPVDTASYNGALTGSDGSNVPRQPDSEPASDPTPTPIATPVVGNEGDIGVLTGITERIDRCHSLFVSTNADIFTATFKSLCGTLMSTIPEWVYQTYFAMVSNSFDSATINIFSEDAKCAIQFGNGYSDFSCMPTNECEASKKIDSASFGCATNREVCCLKKGKTNEYDDYMQKIGKAACLVGSNYPNLAADADGTYNSKYLCRPSAECGEILKPDGTTPFTCLSSDLTCCKSSSAATQILPTSPDDTAAEIGVASTTAWIESGFLNIVGAQSLSVTAIPTQIEKGYYEVSGDNITTKSLEIEESGRIIYFSDFNGNGKRDSGESILEPTQLEDIKVNIKKQAELELYNINTGWNLIAIPFIPIGLDGKAGLKAAGLIALLNEDDPEITHVVTFREGKTLIFTERKNGLGQSFYYGYDFSLLPGEGYFIKSMRPGKIAIKGQVFDGPIGVRINPGWNLLQLKISEGNETFASSILQSSNDLKLDVISKWENGMYQNVAFSGGNIYGSDFLIYSTKGYWVRSTDNESVIYRPE